MCMWTLSHSPLTLRKTTVNLPSTVCRDSSGGRTSRIKCPVQSAVSSLSKSTRACLVTNDVLPEGRPRSPLKLLSTVGQPFIWRGSDKEKILVFSDFRNNEANKSESDVFKARSKARPVAAISASIASVGARVESSTGTTVPLRFGMVVAAGSLVVSGRDVAANVGTTVDSNVDGGSGVASPPQAAMRTRKPAGIVSLTRLLIRVATSLFNDGLPCAIIFGKVQDKEIGIDTVRLRHSVHLMARY